MPNIQHENELLSLSFQFEKSSVQYYLISFQHVFAFHIMYKLKKKRIVILSVH